MWVSAIVVPSARDSASTLASRPRSIDAAYKPCVGCRLCALEVVDGYAGFERLTERGDIAVPVENLRSKILMVQSAQNRHRQRATDGLNGTRDRRVLVQR